MPAAAHGFGRRSPPLGRCGRAPPRGPDPPGGAANLRSTAPLAPLSQTLQGLFQAPFNGLPATRRPPGRVPAPCRPHSPPIAEIRASGSVQHVF